MSSIRVSWSQENYEWAMSLKGRVSSAVAERITGIPNATIRRWWGGRAPLCRQQRRKLTHCHRGHPLEGHNELWMGNRKRQCRICKTEANRRYRHRANHIFHPVYNPDLALAPLHHLWLRGSDILAFIDTRYSRSEVWAQLDKSTGEYGRWSALCSGRDWLRYDAADRLFIRIGLVLSEMDVEPHYCRDPRYLPREETTVAA